MTHDPEAAWPLTDTETGYFPNTDPTLNLPPSNLMPYTKVTPPSSPSNSRPSNKGVSPGMRVAYLAIILGAAIPLTAIAASEFNLIGMIVAWAGIVLVAAFTLGRGR